MAEITLLLVLLAIPALLVYIFIYMPIRWCVRKFRTVSEPPAEVVRPAPAPKQKPIYCDNSTSGNDTPLKVSQPSPSMVRPITLPSVIESKERSVPYDISSAFRWVKEECGYRYVFNPSAESMVTAWDVEMSYIRPDDKIRSAGYNHDFHYSSPNRDGEYFHFFRHDYPAYGIVEVNPTHAATQNSRFVTRITKGDWLVFLNTQRDVYDAYIKELPSIKAQLEREAIAKKIKERYRKRELEKLVRQELIDSGELYGEQTKRPPIPREVVDAVYKRDGGRCVYCGSVENLHLDHIIPFSRGGATNVENLQLLCQKCNLEKSNKIG